VFVSLCASGDPARLILGHSIADAVTQFRRQAGLEGPLGRQYIRTSAGSRSWILVIRDASTARGSVATRAWWEHAKAGGSGDCAVVMVSLLMPLLLRWSGAECS